MQHLTSQEFKLATCGFLVVLLALVLFPGSMTPAGDPPESWKQFGGPKQDFRPNATGLAKEWPEEGPNKLWDRKLGDGYSAILAENGRLYTMYRSGEQEAVICLSAKNGKTIWEHKYDASPREGHITEFGTGPRSTPLLAGDTIYAIGVVGKMHALKKKNGKVLWSHDLWDELGGNILPHGYASSPIGYKNTVITLVGGEGQSIVAFNMQDGSVAWKSESFQNSYSTPKIIEINGKDQLVTFMATELIGMNPSSGELLWSYSHQNPAKQNVNMPVSLDDNHLFLSSPVAGARGLKLIKKGDKTEVEEVWSTHKIQFFHVSTVQDGEYVYGTTGTAFMAAVNIKTGAIAWRKRFPKSNILLADGRLIILDEDGKLYLATASPEDLVVHSQVELLDGVAWTVPTLVGKTLFIRDKSSILALDLG